MTAAEGDAVVIDLFWFFHKCAVSHALEQQAERMARKVRWWGRLSAGVAAINVGMDLFCAEKGGPWAPLWLVGALGFGVLVVQRVRDEGRG